MGGAKGSPDLDPLIHQPTRLRILGALHRNRRLTYKTLRDGLRLTDGNLASHAQRLEGAGYLKSARVLTPSLGFEVVYRITPEGDAAFRRYLDSLRALLDELQAPPSEAGDASSAEPEP